MTRDARPWIGLTLGDPAGMKYFEIPLAIQDRVFLGGPHADPEYAARREGLFLVAVNCSRSAATA